MTTVHLHSHGIKINGAWVYFRFEKTNEYKFIELLLLRQRGYVSTNDLMDWLYLDHEDPPLESIMGVIAARSRKKLKSHGMEIESKHGFGWRLKVRPRVMVMR